jgi:polysaccharide export outer membrane protein
MLFRQFIRRAQLCAAIAGTMLLAGCASMPASGPTAHELLRGTQPDRNTIGMQVVDIDTGVIAQETASDAGGQASAATLASLAREGRNDTVGPGDQLDIAVFEVGASLFGTPRVTAGGYDPSAQAQRFPTMVVDREGNIRLPYAGTIQALGRTPAE